MGFYRVWNGDDGESHMEEVDPTKYPEFAIFTNNLTGDDPVADSNRVDGEVSINMFDGQRNMDFHPAPNDPPGRRLIIHLSGEVEIGTSDGNKHIFRAGDVRLMEDMTDPGHTHFDLSPSNAFHVLLPL
tara:strand:- start:104 stop:490 length:387 start_codon:yes stop_codon:yes gene_type:complete